MKSYLLFETECMIDDGDYIIYLLASFGAIYRIHKTTGKLEFLWQHKGNDRFRSFIRYNNKYILFSQGADIIGVLNSFHEDAILINLPNNLHKQSENNWSARYIRYKESYFFYLQNPIVTKYNPQMNEWKVYRNWVNDLPGKISPEDWMISEAFIHDNKLYFPIGESKFILEIDPQNDTTQIHTLKLPNNIKCMKFLRYKNGVIYIVCKNINNTITILLDDSFLSQKFKELAQINDKFNYDDLFIPIVVGEKFLWLLPGKHDKTYKINLKNGEVKNCNDEIPTLSMHEIKRLAEFVFYNDVCYNYECGFKHDDIFWTINVFTGELVKIDLKTDQVSVIKILFPEEMCDELICRKKLVNSKYEGHTKLNQFLDLVIIATNIRKKISYTKKNSISESTLRWKLLFNNNDL